MAAADTPSRLDDERLRRLIDAGRSLVSERDLEHRLNRVLAVARELTGARYAAVGVLDERREGLADFITAGLHPEVREAISELPRGRGVLGLLVSHPAPLRIADVTAHDLAYGFPADHPPMRSFLGVPILIDGGAWGNLYLADKLLSVEFDDADEESAVVLSRWAALAVKNARLNRQVDQYRAELEQSVLVLEATADIARAAGAEARLERVLELIAGRSRALVNASAVAILLDEGDELVVAAVAGDIPRTTVGRTIAKSDSIAARALAFERPGRVSDIPAQLRLGLRDLGVQMRAVMFAPLQFRDVRLGVMFACHRIDGPQFCAEDEPRLLAAATGAATAVATAQPIERERLRITLHGPQRHRRSACELEDQQLLRALGRLRQAIAAAHRKRDLAVWQLTGAEAIEQIEQQIASLRATIGARHATELDELGLVAALRALVDRTRAQTGVQIIVRLQIPATDSDQVPGRGPELEAVAYEIVHQALEDAAVLAQANRVKVAVLLHNNALQITVRDDGGATDRELSRSDVGLPGMREQIALLGGTLQITSDGAGTAVIATLPLGPAAAAGRATKG